MSFQQVSTTPPVRPSDIHVRFLEVPLPLPKKGHPISAIWRVSQALMQGQRIQGSIPTKVGLSNAMATRYWQEAGRDMTYYYSQPDNTVKAIPVEVDVRLPDTVVRCNWEYTPDGKEVVYVRRRPGTGIRQRKKTTRPG